jgi:hypothetical protein
MQIQMQFLGFVSYNDYGDNFRRSEMYRRDRWQHAERLLPGSEILLLLSYQTFDCPRSRRFCHAYAACGPPIIHYYSQGRLVRGDFETASLFKKKKKKNQLLVNNYYLKMYGYIFIFIENMF